VVRDLKIRYVRSWLGIIWGMVTPLVQVLVFVFLFSSVLRLDGHPQVPSLVFVAVLAWAWFQNGLISAAGAITDNRDLVKRPGFPLAILPLVSIGVNLIDFVLAIPVLFLVAFGLDGLTPHPALAFFRVVAAA
jgi:lipopolysaccharide transport system permease protein